MSDRGEHLAGRNSINWKGIELKVVLVATEEVVPAVVSHLVDG